MSVWIARLGFYQEAGSHILAVTKYPDAAFHACEEDAGEYVDFLHVEGTKFHADHPKGDRLYIVSEYEVEGSE
jgi:hypothetical protein